jgi:hypothetical protein
MSSRPTSRSPDLQRLRDVGYNIQVVAGHLVVRDVPYVNSNREVKRGTLVSTLTLNGDVAQRPGDHIAYWAGEQPCRKDGTPITGIHHQAQTQELVPGLPTQYSFSNKPPEGYPDYFEKMSRYVEVISNPAKALDDTATAQTFPLVAAEPGSSPFLYEDTASSRAGIAAVNAKCSELRIAIVGLGGSGSYVLDYTVKTPVSEIHLFDGDDFLQHNAFRAPGPTSGKTLQTRTKKAAHWANEWSVMRTGVMAHPYHIDENNVAELDGFSYVFLCLDKGGPKRAIIARLQAKGIPFVDVGMGLEMSDGKIAGILRVTTSSAAKTDHAQKRIPFGDGEDELYSRNIQVAELNALNAALAVVKWKKLCGVYRDLEGEHHTTFTVDGNAITNEETA